MGNKVFYAHSLKLSDSNAGSADLIVIGEIDIVKIIHIHLELVKP